MKAIVITPKDESEARFITDLLLKLRIAAKEVSEESLEDAAMWSLLQEANRAEKVSREEVMGKLKD